MFSPIVCAARAATTLLRCRIVFAFVIFAAFVAACSTDAPNSLGSDGDLIGSEPGVVFEDTINVSADTSYVFETPIAGDSVLTLGRGEGFIRTMILQPGFAELESADTTRVVQSAELRLVASDVTGSFPARFYVLSEKYAEGDSVGSLDTVAVIVDPQTSSADRTMQAFPATYPLPPALVQEWIRDPASRRAIAILYMDPGTDRLATFRSQDAEDDRPRIQVVFAGGIQRNLRITHDATRVRPLATPAHLVITDGFVRRTYFRVNLDEIAEDAAVHTARVRFHIVPGSLIGDNTDVVVYVPEATNPSRTAFRTGQAVTEKDITTTDTTLEFPITNAVFLMLQGDLADNGFVIRFQNENTELRQVELYGSDAAPNLRPQVFITSSTPADFDP